MIRGLPSALGSTHCGGSPARSGLRETWLSEPAANHLSPAQEASKALARDAWQSGFLEGRVAGLEQGIAEGKARGLEDAAAEVRAQIYSSTAALRAARSDLLALAVHLQQADALIRAGAEDDVVALCLELVGRIFGQLAQDPGHIRAMLAQLRCAGPEPGARWRGHVQPELVELLQDPEAQGLGGFIEWVADASMSGGGCVIHSGRGELDLRLDTILQAARASLLDLRQSSPERAGTLSAP